MDFEGEGWSGGRTWIMIDIIKVQLVFYKVVLFMFLFCIFDLCFGSDHLIFKGDGGWIKFFSRTGS